MTLGSSLNCGACSRLASPDSDSGCSRHAQNPGDAYRYAMARLAGKVALITGGARGQGAAEARRFAAEGATVCVTDVLAAGNDVASEVGGTFFEHDVTEADQWEAVVKSLMADHGSIDVLINNAGIFQLGGVLASDRELWDTTIAINQTGVFLGMSAVAPAMVENRSGSIINVSSIAGLRGVAVAHAYAASKWAVRGMSRSAAQELAPHGVRVNSIHPGIIDTPMLQTFDNAGLRASVTERIPLGYEATAEQVADMALFLASDDSSYCTGGEFVIDGGMTA